MEHKSNSLDIPEDVRIKRRTWAEGLQHAGLTWESFQQVVQQKIAAENLSFIVAVYRTFDEYFEKEVKASGVNFTCTKGCSHCCHTFITSTEKETDEAIRFVNQLPRTVRMPIVRRALAQARKWRDFSNDNQFKLQVEPFKVYKSWREPCPFLGETGACDIYPVRIVDCRTLTTVGPCKLPEVKYYGDIFSEGAVRYRFLSEHWASNLIMQNIQQQTGLSSPTQVPVSPILQWLYIKRKELG